MAHQDNTHTTPIHTNRLVHETSPYLLQHVHNPVDWYPWSAEALAAAKSQDKPIFLSVGYAACHWCHVMAHESFENEATARYLNEHFISIKVDREERPDIDALYMDAVQAMTGSGGWPMSVFLTPDSAPFYGGTYFPPQDRYGMPGFPHLLRNIVDLWVNRRDEVEQQAEEFRQFYQRQSQLSLPLPAGLDLATAEVDPAVLDQASDRLLAQIDALHGGFGRAPKFPHPMGLEFLLRMLSRSPDALANSLSDASAERSPIVPLLRLTLDKMADGGIYDQVGGGFHRYSTDAVWLVPHFEKMLYDNALLAPVYLHAWQVFGDERYRHVCEEILDYTLREMTDPAGGFYSTQDADSEGEEGKFYVWTPDELHDALGETDAAVVAQLWGVSQRGNFEGKNILHIARSFSEVAHDFEMDEATVREIVTRAREKLYAVRAERVWPGRDDKVLTAWNGLMLRAMAEAARILNRDDYRRAAIANADFLTQQMVTGGRLRRSWRNGEAKTDAYLEDFAALVNGLLSVYEATGETRYFTQARSFADELLTRFWDHEGSGFFDTAHDAQRLIGRPRELTDNATPSGTSLATEALLRLAALTGEYRYREHALRVLVPLAGAMADQPSSFSHLLCALDDLIGPFYEVAVLGNSTQSGTGALLQALTERFLPRMIISTAAPGDTHAQSEIALLADRGLVDGLPAAYVCQGFVCQRPVTAPEDLLVLLR